MQFSNLMKAIGYGVGATAGGPTQLKLAGATAKLKGKINEEVRKLGQRIGPYTGGNIFDSLAKGANQSASQESKDFINKNLLTSQVKKGIGFFGILVVAALVYWLIFRRRG